MVQLAFPCLCWHPFAKLHVVLMSVPLSWGRLPDTFNGKRNRRREKSHAILKFCVFPSSRTVPELFFVKNLNRAIWHTHYLVRVLAWCISVSERTEDPCADLRQQSNARVSTLPPNTFVSLVSHRKDYLNHWIYFELNTHIPISIVCVCVCVCAIARIESVVFPTLVVHLTNGQCVD